MNEKKFSIYIYIYVYICVIYSVGNQCEQKNKDHPWIQNFNVISINNLILKWKKKPHKYELIISFLILNKIYYFLPFIKTKRKNPQHNTNKNPENARQLKENKNQTQLNLK